MFFLKAPSKNFKESYLNHLDEVKSNSGMHALFPDTKVRENFDWFVQALLDCRSEAGVRKHGDDLVPMDVFWLVNDQEYIGRISIRHYLNKELRSIGGHIGYDIRPSQRKKGFGSMIMLLGLKEAKKKGFNKVLVTCDETNIGSRKIIERFDGQFEGKHTDGLKVPKLRYWIHVKN